jgi:hypothetical protein
MGIVVLDNLQAREMGAGRRAAASARLSRQAILAVFVVLILFSTFFLQLAWTPRVARTTADSGLFAYIGQQIIEGRLPYRDAWDHKPPGVFYVDALAMLVLGQNPWALWWLGLVWISLTAAALFLILNRFTGVLSAALAVLVFLFTLHYPDYYQGGNYTEVYALLPQVLSIGALAAWLRSGRLGWLACLGLLTAACILFKPTYIALDCASLAVVFFLELRRRNLRRLILDFGTFTAGLALPLLLVAGYFALRGAFNDFWGASITYNALYAERGFSLHSLLVTLKDFAVTLPMASLTISSGIAFLVCLYRVWQTRLEIAAGEQTAGSIRLWVFACVVLAVPLEIGFVAVSGMNFGHYFMTPLPALAASLAFLLSEFAAWMAGRWKHPQVRQSIALLGLLALAGAWMWKDLPVTLPSRSDVLLAVQQPFYGSYLLSDTERYILQNSLADQTVYVWSIHPSINWITGRRSPSPYLYPLHLIWPSGDNRQRFQRVMSALQSAPPVFILDQLNSAVGIPALSSSEADPCSSCIPDVRQGYLTLRDFLRQHYTLVEHMGDWLIYRYNQ